MRRIVWVALGAAGGILAYRKGQDWLAAAREQGVVLSAQQAALSAATAVSSARALASTPPAPVPARPGRAAALALARHATTRGADRGVR
jgi:hypothetical protein